MRHPDGLGTVPLTASKSRLTEAAGIVFQADSRNGPGVVNKKGWNAPRRGNWYSVRVARRLQPRPIYYLSFLEAFYRARKWAFGKTGEDKTTIIYNPNITMQNIPLEAYDDVVSGKPALEWVMERQVVQVDKQCGIEHDANRYAAVTIGNPVYPLELFQRVITVSLRTIEIVRVCRSWS